MKKVELVAPAGGPEMFFTVCDAKPDAIYAGLRGFGESPSWRGCTLSELTSLIPYARNLGIKVHLYLDTVVNEGELSGMLDLVIGAVELHPDLLVVQDAGMLRLIKHFFPATRVQAGLGFSVHNHSGVNVARTMGADRVALLPEVHVNDIARIVRSTGAEIELLAHGPLGYAMSGQCLLSSYIDGNSANRGRCSRPCMEVFQNGRYSGRPFATRDLDTLSIIPRLVKTGITAVRIAGRSKNAEEIARTVGAYRRALESASRMDDTTRETESTRRPHSGAGGRAGSIGYYLGSNTDLLDPQSDSRRGVYLGCVQQMNQDTIGITPEKGVRIGDKLEIRSPRDGTSRTFIVKEIFLRNKRMRSGRIGEMIRIGVPHVFSKGDEVYRLPQDAGSQDANNKARELLRTLAPRREALDVQLTWRPGKIEVAASLNNQPFVWACEFQPVKETTPISAGNLKEIFIPPKSSPFEAGSFASQRLPVPGPSIWDLKSMATNFYRAAEAERIRRQQDLRREIEIAVCRTSHNPQEHPLDEVIYRVHLPHANALIERVEEDDVLYSLDASPRRMDSLSAALEQAHVGLDRLAFQLPPWMWEGEIDEFRSLVATLAERGARNWYIGNAAQFELFEGLTVNIATGPSVQCYNSGAARALKRAGARIVSVAVEDDGQNWSRLAVRSAGVALEAPLFSHPALFISRTKPDHASEHAVLTAASGIAARYHRGESWSEVRTAEAVALLGHRQELCDMGFRRFLIDLSSEPWNRLRCKEILELARASKPLEGAGAFNYRRGLV